MRLPASKDIFYVSIQLLLFIMYFFPVLDFDFQLSVYVKYISLIIASVGLLIVFIAIIQLNKNLTPFPTPKENGTLIQTGLYKFVRHPVYSGIIITAIGFGCYNGSLFKTAIGFALWLLFYFKSGYEEALLKRHFKDYAEYQKSTYRLFPFF